MQICFRPFKVTSQIGITFKHLQHYRGFQMDLRPFSVSATVTEVTAMFGRCSTGEVQIVTTAVQHLNVDGPSTAV